MRKIIIIDPDADTPVTAIGRDENGFRVEETVMMTRAGADGLKDAFRQPLPDSDIVVEDDSHLDGRT